MNDYVQHLTQELTYINLINNVEGKIPYSFVEKYLKFHSNRISITPSGISVLISEYQKLGKINIECRSCKDHNTLKIELKGLINMPGNVSKGFTVKAKDPYNHLTPIYAKKYNDKILILITDSQGGEKNYDPSTLYDLKELGGNKIFEIYNLTVKRDFDFTKEGAFAFHDLLSMCEDDNILDRLRKLNKPDTFLSYLPEIKFKSISLSDLPSSFSASIDKDFSSYIKIIKSRLKYEYHVKTTYNGNLITPRGLNMLIILFKNNFRYYTIALETHDELLRMLRYQKNETRCYMVKSKEPFDHITPLFVKKLGNEYQVILSDSQGGDAKNYDFAPLIDFDILRKEDKAEIVIYNVIGRRQYDNNTCPIYSFYDLLALNKLQDPFNYFNKNFNKELIFNEKYSSVKFYPIYLDELPTKMMMLMSRYRSLTEYADTLSENKRENFMNSVNKHIKEIKYGEKNIKSNMWAEEINNEYAEIIRKNIV